MTCDRKGSILVIDDEESIGRLLTAWLDNQGYESTYAMTFADAKQRIGQGDIDLVTLDIIMPDVDGMTVLHWIRENHPDIGVLMATAIGEIDTVLEAMRAGATNYLLKPFNLELAATEIDRAMERQRLIAENRAHQEELERRVAEQTAEIRAAHRELQRKVCELEGRDQLVQCQMGGPTEEEAERLILQVVNRVFQPREAALVRAAGDGSVRLAAGTLAGEGLDVVGDVLREQTAHPDGQVARPASATGAVELIAPLVYQTEVLGALQVQLLATTEESTATLGRLAQQAAVTLWSAGISAALDRDDLPLQELMEIE